ncbi:hypothetical protein BB776_05200 [Planococcus salinarum]|uniref:Uncharacterized protein n=1 Tax=Planococcus salinarum TaxID=622695 RepID=A0ABX3D1J0_9BACL|nr:hypothetical protein [Planococcus salinarum]OHX56247.1 hypothetical protein BB776_05200 [Planococcus salinarum]TAA70639.1 hypothetical protein D2909_10975 [Planococcus salinarum]
MEMKQVEDSKETHTWRTKTLGELLEFKNGLNYRTGDQGEEISIVGVSDFKNTFLIDVYGNLKLSHQRN